MKLTSQVLHNPNLVSKATVATTRKLNKLVDKGAKTYSINTTFNKLIRVSDFYAKANGSCSDGVLRFHVLPACRKAAKYLKDKGYTTIFNNSV